MNDLYLHCSKCGNGTDFEFVGKHIFTISESGHIDPILLEDDPEAMTKIRCIACEAIFEGEDIFEIAEGLLHGPR